MENANALTVVYREIRNLTPYPRNARTHSKPQIRQIADSIRAFGFTNPVLVDRQGTIVAGHGRLEAAKLLGLHEVPTICLENLSPDQIRAYILADNKLAEKAGWDNSILAIELQHLTSVDLGFDVSLTGFEIGEIDLILQESKSEEIEEQPVEISTQPPFTKLGDVWLLGKHRLMCADALDETAYQILMNGQSADMVFTDPRTTSESTGMFVETGQFGTVNSPWLPEKCLRRSSWSSWPGHLFSWSVTLNLVRSISFAWIGATSANSSQPANEPITPYSTFVFGPKTLVEWARSIDLSTNWFSSFEREMKVTATIFSSADSDAIAPMFGATRGSTRCREPVAKAICWRSIQPSSRRR
jgi:ParB-like nuclease domain